MTSFAACLVDNAGTEVKMEKNDTAQIQAKHTHNTNTVCRLSPEGDI